MLHLDYLILPFFLFLYHNSIDGNTESDVYVMTRAWYSVVPTGAQAAVAINLLSEFFSSEYTSAVEVLSKDIYVDDVNPETEPERDKQISSTQSVLEQGGFGFKYLVYSGRIPRDKASPDGIHMKLIGYKWNSELDVLYPGFAELKLNKKVQGAKKSNLLPVITSEDAGCLMFWEPWKLQLKLLSQSLAGMDWDEYIPAENQDLLKQQLSNLVDFPKLSISRICIPADNDSVSGIRFICLTDAATTAGGAAVYASRKLKDSTWSYSLVASKSKLMKATVPRNELSALMLVSELIYLVAKSMDKKVKYVIFETDSTIALSWCYNPTKKLRLFVFSRVETIRRMIEWNTGREYLPIYHVDGNLNLLDLLTKKHDLTVEDLSTGSDWQTGLPWMRLGTKTCHFLHTSL